MLRIFYACVDGQPQVCRAATADEARAALSARLGIETAATDAPAVEPVDITDALLGELGRLVELAQQQVKTGPAQWQFRYPGARAIRALLGEECCCVCGQPMR